MAFFGATLRTRKAPSALRMRPGSHLSGAISPLRRRGKALGVNETPEREGKGGHGQQWRLQGAGRPGAGRQEHASGSERPRAPHTWRRTRCSSNARELSEPTFIRFRESNILALNFLENILFQIKVVCKDIFEPLDLIHG